ncbi:MAG: DUF6273 domain-containing protein [Lachnospiraceae bacterium]
MKKKITTKSVLITTLFTFAVSFGGCDGNDSPVAATPTVSVEATIAPTGEPTVTLELTAPTVVPDATETPVVSEAPEVTEEVAPTEAVIPTEEPIPTVEPTATSEPTLVPTSTPIPTVTVAPTVTPEPTATPKATATPKPTVTPTPVPAKGIVAGDYVAFGNYEQDNDFSNGKEPIEWLVLEVKDGKAFLISKYCLDGHQYHSQAWMSSDPGSPDFNVCVNVTWETSDLRAWLGSEFLNSAFTATEQESIILTTVKNPDHSNGFEGGNDTLDKVYLLSRDEVLKYFGEIVNLWHDELPNETEHIAAPTEYAKTRNIGYKGDKAYSRNWYDKYANWWLRSPGMGTNWGAYVADAGILMEDGSYVTGTCAVRPVLWLDVESADVEKVK